MRLGALDFLRSPETGSRIEIRQPVEQDRDEIKTGELAAADSGLPLPLGEGLGYAPLRQPFSQSEKGAIGANKSYMIRNFIPRFVADDSYTASFGEQWNRYRRTQLDRFNGTTLSRDRFFRDTKWTPEELSGQRILEVGCGAGRFTQVMLDAGAELFSMDYSSAVDACWANNGPHPQLTLVQADLLSMPFPPSSFDKVFCYGVIQHTPDVKRAFMSLVPFLKPGGEIAVDVYPKTRWITRWTSKNWYRPLTKRMPRDLLRRIVEWYVPRWIPIDNKLQSVRILRYLVPALVPCWNYTGMLPLSDQQIKDWAVLDTFDALSPRYDSPQTISTMQAWFQEAGLKDVDVRPGGNGILGNGRTP